MRWISLSSRLNINDLLSRLNTLNEDSHGCSVYPPKRLGVVVVVVVSSLISMIVNVGCLLSQCKWNLPESPLSFNEARYINVAVRSDLGDIHDASNARSVDVICIFGCVVNDIVLLKLNVVVDNACFTFVD